MKSDRVGELTLEQLRDRFTKFSTTVVSDAMDSAGILNNAVSGIRPVWKCPTVFGRAVTVRNIPAGTHTQKNHGGFVTAQHIKPGDIIVVDNSGDIENNGWGELVAMAAMVKGAVATLVDGAVRDVDAYEKMGYPVFAKGVTPRTARGRLVQDAININIRFHTAHVRPGDYILADSNGVCIIPPERVKEVLLLAEEIEKKESALLEELKKGLNPIEAQNRIGYETMLKK